MQHLFDLLFTNEYAFTFIVCFISVLLKTIANKQESMRAVLRGEAFDFGPELIFISISFAASAYTQAYSDSDISTMGILKIIIFHLFMLVLLVVFLKRISVNNTGEIDPTKGMYVPLLLGFLSLFLVLTYTLNL